MAMREVVAGKLAAGIGIGAAAVAAAAFGSSSRTGPSQEQVNHLTKFGQDLNQPAVRDVSQLPQTTFQMDSLLGDMQGLELDKKQGPLQGPAITEFALQQDWAQEFLKNEQNVRVSGAAWAGDYFSAELDPVWNDSCKAGSELNHMNQEIIQHHGLQQTAQDLLDDSKWVGQYNDEPPALIGGKTELMTTAEDLLHSVTDPSIKATEFMSYVEKLSTGEVVLQNRSGLDLAENWASEYDFQFGNATGNSDWAQEYATQGDFTGSQSAAKEEFWQNLQNEWERLALEESEQHPWLTDGNSAVNQTYKFNETNPFQDLGDPLQEGKRRLLQGDIPSAVLAFESAAQQNPDNPEAWHLLGTTQAQNEQDPMAISAFNKCLQLQPENLSALMALAASLTNESFQLQASNALKQWITVNPKYKNLVPPETATSDQVPKITSFLSSKELNTVQQLFVDAARLNPTGVDPDVQSGLGILFNLGNDYEKAADCFKAALGVKPHDSLLWNRLGATLANGGLSAEAISAYRRALELSPGFIRTRYNLGISCINLNAYREAAEHFLSSLNQQAAGRGLDTNVKSNVMSDSIWTSLRMILHLMDRADLTSLVDSRDLARLNQEFNIV